MGGAAGRVRCGVVGALAEPALEVDFFLPPPPPPPPLARPMIARSRRTANTPPASSRPGLTAIAGPATRRSCGGRARVGGAKLGASSSPRGSCCARNSSTSRWASRPRYSAYVRRKLLTYVVPGSIANSSFSSARRYFARILVAASTSVMSRPCRMRASRSLSPMGCIGVYSGAAVRLGGVARGGPDRVVEGRQDAREVGLGDQHLPRLRALVARDHATPLHHVDQPPRPGVAHPEPPLEHRGRSAAQLHDRRDRVGQQVVLIGAEFVHRLALAGLDRLQQLLVQLGLALATPVVGEPLDLLLGHEGALDAGRTRLRGRPEQHVALPEQRLRAVLVEDHARVGLRRDG